VNQAGYLPFRDGCESDHRLICAGFSFRSAFGQVEVKPPQIAIRKLKADDPRLAKRYNRKVKAALVKEGLIQKAFALQVQVGKHERSTELENDYNWIQGRNVQIRKEIESRLRKLRMGGVEWSPKLQKYCDKIELWKMMKKRCKGRRVSTKRICCWMRKTDEMEAFTITSTAI
jgi:hypothetical protein